MSGHDKVFARVHDDARKRRLEEDYVCSSRKCSTEQGEPFPKKQAGNVEAPLSGAEVPSRLQVARIPGGGGYVRDRASMEHLALATYKSGAPIQNLSTIQETNDDDDDAKAEEEWKSEEAEEKDDCSDDDDDYYPTSGSGSTDGSHDDAEV